MADSTHRDSRASSQELGAIPSDIAARIRNVVEGIQRVQLHGIDSTRTKSYSIGTLQNLYIEDQAEFEYERTRADRELVRADTAFELLTAQNAERLSLPEPDETTGSLIRLQSLPGESTILVQVPEDVPSPRCEPARFLFILSVSATT